MSAVALFAAVLALILAPANRVEAYPSSTPNAAWPTAKVDAQLKPHFRELIGVHRHGYYRRPSWSRWRNFYWRGDCGYEGQGCQGGYDYGDGYGCDPSDPYGCQQQDYGCTPGDPYCQQESYPPCDTRDAYCQGGAYRPGWANGGDAYSLPSISVYGDGHGREHVTVDCRRDDPGRLQRAMDEVADGGTIHLRGRGPACTATLQISRPVIIQGDPPAAFPIDGEAGPAVLTAPPGSPCAVIDAGPRAGVEFRDLVIEAPQGGRSACLQTFSSAVALVRATLHYTGESSALYIQGGRLVMNDAEVDSTGYDAAVWSEDAAIGMRNVGITTASSGLDVRPGVGQTIALNHVSIIAAPSGPGGGGPMSGVIGRRGRGGESVFTLENSYVAGFRTGMLFEPGLGVDIKHSRVDQSRMGVALDGGHLSMHDTAIDATEYGVYVYSGRAEITGGLVTSVLREPFGADPGAGLITRDVAIYADGCGRWGRHDGWLCHSSREAPPWRYRREDYSARHWGWN